MKERPKMNPNIVASVERALRHHLETGAIARLEVDHDQARPFYVDVPGVPHGGGRLSNSEAWALCIGLAAGERRWKDLAGQDRPSVRSEP